MAEEVKRSEIVAEISEQVTKTINNTLEEMQKGLEARIDKSNEVQRKYIGNIGSGKVDDEPLKKGHGFVRTIKMNFQSNKNKIPFEQQCEKIYGKEDKFVKKIKSIINKTDGMNVTFPSEGGYLVQEQYAQEIIELLRSKVFLFQAGARRIPMPKGNLNMPVHTAGALSFFEGEGCNALPVKQAVGNIKLMAKKQISMVLMSDELLMDNSYGADQIFLEDMLNEMAVVLNFTALYGTGTVNTPLGLKNHPGVPKVDWEGLGNTKVDVEFPAIVKGDIMKTDVPKTNLASVWNGVLWSQFYNLTDGNGAFIYRDEMNNMKLVGDTFNMFNRVEIGTGANEKTDYFYGDWSEFVVGEQSMFNVATSKEATITDGSGKNINLFQAGWTAIKVTSFYDFALRHPEAFVVYTDIHTK